MQKVKRSTESGFSLIELLVAMAITLFVMGAASAMLASSFRVRTRENARSQAIADAQRALNSMTREIASAGLGLYANGIVNEDSGATSIRVRSNLDAVSETAPVATNDDNEDVKYRLIADANGTFLVRQNLQPAPGVTEVIANPVQTMVIRYFTNRLAWTTASASTCNISLPATLPTGTTEITGADKSTAKYVVVSLCVNLPAAGTPGSDGYQPPSQTQLVSDVLLRNSMTVEY